jgi:hypothetical protein
MDAFSTIRNGHTIMTENYGVAVVVDVDHGGLTLLVRVQRTRDSSFEATVYCDEVRPCTATELHALYGTDA